MQSMKRVVVQADGDNGFGARLAYSLALADKFGATLTAVFAKRFYHTPVVMDAMAVADIIDAQRQASNALAEKLQAAFREAMPEAAGHEFLSIDGSWEQAITHLSYSADLVVLGQNDSSDLTTTAPYTLVGDALMECGRPILVVPYIGAAPGLPKRILVAWKDGQEASRAVMDAMPFMTDAKVKIVTVAATDETVDNAGPAVAAWLGQHGIEAEFDEIRTDQLSPGDAILARLGDMDIDMLVMGGYSHSRLRETVLGGATSDLLQHMTVPVLMSH